jgi:hypothetical protein
MHQNMCLATPEVKKNVWSVLKRVLMHLRILPDHQNQVLKKDIFLRLEWLKTCFDEFPGHQNEVLKKLFFNLRSV